MWQHLECCIPQYWLKTLNFELVSLHIHSMWETICDALHIPVGRIFDSKFLECPTQVFQECWSGVPTTPLKMKIWADLGTLDLSWSGVPPNPHRVLRSSYVETNFCIPMDTISLTLSCVNCWLWLRITHSSATGTPCRATVNPVKTLSIFTYLKFALAKIKINHMYFTTRFSIWQCVTIFPPFDWHCQ